MSLKPTYVLTPLVGVWYPPMAYYHYSSGTIDLDELKTMLHDMEMDYTDETLRNLIKEVDADGSGQIGES